MTPTPLIYIVELEPQLVLPLRRRLEGRGARVELAHSEPHGRYLIERARPDALYLSEPLWQGNGGDLMAHIDRDPRLDALPILLRVSEHESVWARAMRRGGLQTVTAPFDLDAVAARLDRMSRGGEGELRALINHSRCLHRRSRDNRQHATSALERLRHLRNICTYGESRIDPMAATPRST